MTNTVLHAPTLAHIRSAAQRLEGFARRTPLLAFEAPEHAWQGQLKLENLQPIGSFKVRGAANAMRLASPAALARGACTASAGNMAQGVAWCARRAGIPCVVIVPERAPQTKLHAIERLGARIVKVPTDEWWSAMVEHGHPAATGGVFVHPFADAAVLAGNGTIGLEILDDLPDVDAVLVPWGGGGLACGIAAALRALGSQARVYPVEVATAAPLSASFAAGRPVDITPEPSFIDGIGGRGVFPEMWTLAQALLERPLIVSVAQVAAAVKLLVEHARIVAEGAGAAPLAAAMAQPLSGARSVVCIVSGGNVDAHVLADILAQDPDERASD